ncbi:hypothetical protein [Paraburkholderia sacchari]|uniref:hypothetical protein n=2 Tax=Paraburkholderia sacchari TaxID=159450 RepID=UPI001BCC4F7C
MNAMNENDSFRLTRPVEAEVIGEHTAVTLPAGTTVTVVLVFGDPVSPEAYEVEAYLPETNTYALATIPAREV